MKKPPKKPKPSTNSCNAACRHRRRAGDPDAVCKLLAGFGTDHVGTGRCRFHGGATPVQHGRYSTVERNSIRELFEKLQQQDSNPLDLVPDLNMARAVLIDFMNRYQQFSNALIAWHESFSLGPKREKKPMTILDIADASKMIERVSRIVAVIVKIQEEGSISIETFKRLQEQMAIAVSKHVTDAKTLRNIEKEWQGIKVTPSFI